MRNQTTVIKTNPEMDIESMVDGIPVKYFTQASFQKKILNAQGGMKKDVKVAAEYMKENKEEIIDESLNDAIQKGTINRKYRFFYHAVCQIMYGPVVAAVIAFFNQAQYHRLGSFFIG